MTSLRTFQNEIDQIQHREVAKQRTQALVIEKIKEKDVKKPPAKPGEVEVFTAPAAPVVVEEAETELAGTEGKIQVCKLHSHVIVLQTQSPSFRPCYLPARQTKRETR